MIRLNHILKLSSSIAIFFFAPFFCSGQRDYSKFNPDSSKVISKKDFNNLIDSCINLLQTKELTQISDSGHIDIMMCFNTSLYLGFREETYKILKNLLEEKDYWRKIITIYPDWIYNRGEGYYFRKLKMEVGGTPRRYAIFRVIK